jgi:hypothetical protein
MVIKNQIVKNNHKPKRKKTLLSRAKKVKFLNKKTLLFAFAILILLLVLKKFVIGILLILIFAPLSVITLRFSRFVPHVSIETNTASSIFMGYLFGPTIGFFFCLGVGGYGYVKNSLLNITFISSLIYACFAAVMAGVFHSLNLSFFWCFLLPNLIRVTVMIPYYMLLADPFEVITHQTTHFILNTLVYYQFYSVLLDILLKIGLA